MTLFGVDIQVASTTDDKTALFWINHEDKKLRRISAIENIHKSFKLMLTKL